jgi:hypothetical protein
VVVLAILVAGGGWYWWQAKLRTSVAKATPTEAAAGLSESTKAILHRLAVPVEIRFYAPADLARLPETLQPFAARVAWWLAEYEQGAAGKIHLNRRDPQSDLSAKVAAGTDGVLPNSDRNGEIYYLGIVIAGDQRRETLPQLSADWEAAFESDLSRAILRVTAAVGGPASRAVEVAAIQPIDPQVSEELLRTFPDLATQSFDDVAKNLRAGALEVFKAAAAEMQEKVAVAQQHLAAAQAEKSEAAAQAALRDFQKVQAEQTARLKAITAQLQERLTALERLKGSVPLSTTAQ